MAGRNTLPIANVARRMVLMAVTPKVTYSIGKPCSQSFFPLKADAVTYSRYSFPARSRSFHLAKSTGLSVLLPISTASWPSSRPLGSGSRLVIATTLRTTSPTAGFSLAAFANPKAASDLDRPTAQAFSGGLPLPAFQTVRPSCTS